VVIVGIKYQKRIKSFIKKGIRKINKNFCGGVFGVWHLIC